MVTIAIAGNLIDLMSTKITWKDRKTQTETQSHPFTETAFYRALCFKTRTAGEHRCDVLSLLAFRMLSNCCQLSGWLPFTQKKATFQSHFISGWLCANILPIHYPLNYFLVEKETFCPLTLDWPLLCFTLFSFVQLKVNSQSVFSFLHCSYLSTKGRLSTQALFQHHLALHLHSLLSWELHSTAKLLSSSTGADGIKGKGCSVAVALFYIFTFSSQTYYYALSYIVSGQQMERCWFRPSPEVALRLLHHASSSVIIHQLLYYQLNSNIRSYSYRCVRPSEHSHFWLFLLIITL